MALTLGWIVAAENLIRFLVVLMVGVGGIAICIYAIDNLLEAWGPWAFSPKWRLHIPLAVSGLGLVSFWVYAFYGEAGFQVIHFEWGYELVWLGLISAIVLESTEFLYRRKPP